MYKPLNYRSTKAYILQSLENLHKKQLFSPILVDLEMPIKFTAQWLGVGGLLNTNCSIYKKSSNVQQRKLLL